MTPRTTFLAIASGLACLAVQANAGGPVLIEDTSETVAPDRERNVLPWIIGAGVFLAIISTAGSDSCFTEEPGPAPSPAC